MTPSPLAFEEGAAIVAGLGFSRRQARFLTLVALHSGYCLRRQYAMFAGLAGGRSVHDFFKRLLALRFARRFTFRRDRGDIYHLFGASIYAALGHEQTRNRRDASPARIARKVMLLDFVLTQPDRRWYVTEAEKVDLFIRTLGVPADALPRLGFGTVRQASGPADRYSVRMLPFFVTTGPARVHFVCLVTDPTARDIGLFIRRHQGLLRHLPAHTLIILRPAHISTEDRCRAAYALAMRTVLQGPRALDEGTTAWYFDARRRVEQGELRTLSVADINRYRTCHRRSRGTLDGRYSRWLQLGAPSIDTLDSAVPSTPHTGEANVVIATLPYRYEQFGSFPGVS